MIWSQFYKTDKIVVDLCCSAKDGKYDPKELQTGWKNGDISLGGGWFAILYGGEEKSDAYKDMMIVGHILYYSSIKNNITLPCEKCRNCNALVAILKFFLILFLSRKSIRRWSGACEETAGTGIIYRGSCIKNYKEKVPHLRCGSEELLFALMPLFPFRPWRWTAHPL